MASPVGHSLAGLAVALWALPLASARRDKVLQWVATHRVEVSFLVVLANLADFDYLPGLMLGELNRFHRGVTHSLVFAAAATVVWAMLLGRFRALPKRTAWGAAALASFGHLMVDWLAEDRRDPIGIPLLWPLTDRSFCFPWPVFPMVDKSAILLPQNVFAVCVELLVMGVVCLVVAHAGARATRPRCVE